MSIQDNSNKISALDYYKTSDSLTDIKKYADQIANLPSNLDALVKIIQNLIVHDMWLGRYGIEFSARQVCQQSTPSMQDLLELAFKLKPAPLTSDRTSSEKVIACCREFSALLCAIMRVKGLSARARCGFAAYLAKEGQYEDHWICEVWNGIKWQKIDPQIDDFQLRSIQTWAKTNNDADKEYIQMLLDLNPMNVDERGFVSAGRAWQMCRMERIDPMRFGISCDPKVYNIDSLYGLWFIRGNLLRDFATLNKVELVPFLSGLERRRGYWNSWRLISARDEELTSDDWSLLDRIAALCIEPDKNLKEIVNTYQQHSDLQPTQDILGH